MRKRKWEKGEDWHSWRHCDIWLPYNVNLLCNTLCSPCVFDQIKRNHRSHVEHGWSLAKIIYRHQVSKQSKFHFFFSICYSYKTKRHVHRAWNWNCRYLITSTWMIDIRKRGLLQSFMIYFFHFLLVFHQFFHL